MSESSSAGADVGVPSETRRVRYRWVTAGSTRLSDVGIEADGSLHNPHGYPEALVRSVIAEARERQALRRSAAAKKAAETRRLRRERNVYALVERLREGGSLPGPRPKCFICGRRVHDHESVERGIGSDCWQFVLEAWSNERESA